MTRVKRGNVARKRHKKILKLAKGFRGSLSKLFRPASQAVLHAGINAYKDRRRKKREFRALWIVRINGKLNDHNISYSKFIGECQKKNVELNRKVMANLALENPEIFDEVVNFVTK
jgi:large subunit ribosomal protein L20